MTLPAFVVLRLLWRRTGTVPSTATPLLAADRRCLLSIDISCRWGAQQQTRRRPLLLSIDGTDRLTDARPFHLFRILVVAVWQLLYTSYLLTMRAAATICTVRQKKRNEFSFVCILISYLRKLVIFFTHIRPKETRSIRYDSVYLILARVENFAATVTLNHYYMFYQSSNDDYRLVFIVSVSLIRKVLNACQN